MNLPTWEEAGIIGTIGVFAAPAVIVGWYLCDTAVRDDVAFLEEMSRSLLNIIADLSDCSEASEKPDGTNREDT